MTKPETFFDIYEKTKPVEVKVEKPAEETLFKPEVPEEPKQQTYTLPEGFEENLVNKITAAILEKMQPASEGGDGDGNS